MLLTISVLENHKMFTLNEQGEYTQGISVRGGFVLEVCLAKWWANIGNVECSYSVTFHGLTPEGREQEVIIISIWGNDCKFMSRFQPREYRVEASL